MTELRCWQSGRSLPASWRHNGTRLCIRCSISLAAGAQYRSHGPAALRYLPPHCSIGRRLRCGRRCRRWWALGQGRQDPSGAARREVALKAIASVENSSAAARRCSACWGSLRVRDQSAPGAAARRDQGCQGQRHLQGPLTFDRSGPDIRPPAPSSNLANAAGRPMARARCRRRRAGAPVGRGPRQRHRSTGTAIRARRRHWLRTSASPRHAPCSDYP